MKTVFMLLFLGSLSSLAATEIPIWDGNMPGKAAEQSEGLKPDTGDNVTRLTNVSEPTLAFYPAKDAGLPNAMVIVCPGGGYNILCMDKEGTEVAEWLNSIGVSAAVLKYRVPNNREGALQDAQRAVRCANCTSLPQVSVRLRLNFGLIFGRSIFFRFD